MEQVKLKYLCSSYSTPITQDQIQEAGNYKVYGASGQVGFLAEPGCKSDYLGIIKDGAGVGRISTYEAGSYLLGTMAYIVPNIDIDINWLKYAVMSLNLSESISKTTIPHIYFSEYGNRKVSWCTIEEQRSISVFLDRKCAEIDSVIADTQRTIEEYKKLKQSVITQAVTKGIRGERPMKDSGIEWIGEIPVEWGIRKLFRAIDNLDDIDHYMPNSVDTGIPYLMTGDLKEKLSDVDFDSCKMVSLDDYQTLSSKIKANKGDIIFARYATIGTVCFVDIEKEFLVSYSCLTIKPTENLLLGRFMFYYLKSSAFFEEVNQYINSNTQANVGLDSMTKAKVILPKIEEQTQIADYLDKKCAEIDTLIAKKTALLEELESYKKSVIYEYVTGKKEVPACQ